MLDKEFTYYLEHQEELVKQYNGKVIVIVGEEVVDSHPDNKTAYLEAIKKYEPGTFLLIHCTPGDEGYTYHQRSRIASTA